jgi:phosphoribosylanthranilate isomerase
MYIRGANDFLFSQSNILMTPRVKICCISSIDEARLAVSSGASAVGLVGKMPSGPGVISDALIYEIARTIPPPIASFLLTSETSVDAICMHHSRTQTNTIQLVDELIEGTFAELRRRLPAIKFVQVIHVRDKHSIDEALRMAELADALLLDSGNPSLRVKELGGTGRVHDWSLSRKIADHSRVPVFLAGGLTPENVKEAIERVQPFGIDLCNGVRTDGKLDPAKVDRFFRAAGM